MKGQIMADYNRFFATGINFNNTQSEFFDSGHQKHQQGFDFGLHEADVEEFNRSVKTDVRRYICSGGFT
ncbi:MAG: hypothetical protein GY795_19520 [Desulfobacterales bacterium]|nr:hypothetical protein [Desulfobacterales bacterium]